jgi:protein-S-isoprenylcysteine O-methyltransferase Ste14
MKNTVETAQQTVSSWTYTADLLGRIGIVLFFSFGASGKLKLIFKSVTEWQAASPDFHLLNLLTDIAGLAFLLLVISTTIIRLKPLNAADGIEPRVMALAGTFAMMLLVLLPPSIVLPPLGQMLALGLTLIGFILSTYALYWLGRSFSIMAEARSLVTQGAYGIIRHPLYVAEEVAIIGVLLLNLSLLAVVLAIVHWTIQMRRMRNEERVLAKTFPEYEDYRRRVPMLLPRLKSFSPKSN